MMLKPQDIVVLLKIVSSKGREWTYARLARELHMSASEVHAGVKRAHAARLIDLSRKKTLRSAMEEFLIHGVKYAYPAVRTEATRGIPTSYAAPPLKNLISQSGSDLPVWPSPDGQVRGYGLKPLYRAAPQAAMEDNNLYELLSLVDAIRDGSAREAAIAIKELKDRLQTW